MFDKVFDMKALSPSVTRVANGSLDEHWARDSTRPSLLDANIEFQLVLKK